MRVEALSFIVFFIVLVELVGSHPLNRGTFPRDFLFGTASSSYQVYVFSSTFYGGKSKKLNFILFSCDC